jgi:AraC-like DNA-binding protein
MDSALSLKKISEVFNISESYFSYLFKAETKQNFSEYLELIRMNQAMILLKTTDLNVSDMYLELGYNNANSFRRAFKKVHGVSPKTIRDTMN